jgi:hypothetical protein
MGVTKMKAVKEARKIKVLVRYFIKATGRVVLYVENDKGARYYVTLNRNKQHSCNCVATRRCYHINSAVEIENRREQERKEIAQQFAATNAPSWLVNLVASGQVAAPRVVSKPAQQVSSPKVVDISSKGSLTKNKGFSIERIA